MLKFQGETARIYSLFRLRFQKLCGLKNALNFLLKKNNSKKHPSVFRVQSCYKLEFSKFDNCL